MSCWICNPFCGHCKPPKKKSVTCPSCGKPAFFDVADAITEGKTHKCPLCGADITEFVKVDPEYCKKIGQMCGIPCGSNNDEPPMEGFECVYHTPVDENGRIIKPTVVA